MAETKGSARVSFPGRYRLSCLLQSCPHRSECVHNARRHLRRSPLLVIPRNVELAPQDVELRVKVGLTGFELAEVFVDRLTGTLAGPDPARDALDLRACDDLAARRARGADN